VRLDVRKLGTEEAFRTIDRYLLDHVHMLAATVVALAGEPFCVFVRENRTLSLKNGPTGGILGRNQLEIFLLSQCLAFNRRGDFRIGFP
jgi:hypothetical protein